MTKLLMLAILVTTSSAFANTVVLKAGDQVITRGKTITLGDSDILILSKKCQITAGEDNGTGPMYSIIRQGDDKPLLSSTDMDTLEIELNQFQIHGECLPN